MQSQRVLAAENAKDARLMPRTWARGVTADYAYDAAGNLTSTVYSDTTPTITMAYDRVGNLTEATTAGVVTNLYVYDIVGNCTNEWQNDFNLTRYYDTLGRSTGYAINGIRQTTIAYDTYGRISTMTVPAAAEESDQHHCSPSPLLSTFQWSYLQGSDLKSSLTYPNGLTASWTYDANNQLFQVRNAMPTNVISQFDYTYDAAGRRVSIVKSGSAFGDLSGSVDTYTYNARSELISARRTKNGQPIPGFSEDFDYDPIGNRRSSATYNEKGEAQTSTYQANNLNQYTMRTTPGYAAVRGEADPNATVTVNENPAFRLGSYYFGSDLFDNTAAGGLANLETYATLAQTAANGEEAEDLVSAETNQVYLAQSPETFAYDDDGNQTLITTKTGLWRVTYNGENRPILWVRDSDNTTLTMSYDHMGRRREKNDQRFFYDGYLQVADNTGNSYIWDCTETIATRPLAWLRADFSGFYAHDGNKNVSEVVAAVSGTNATVEVVAHYDYAAFGAVIAQKGGCAEANPWRFSSEYEDTELGLDYYNYRHYEPVTGRWLQRDPIEEFIDIGLYVWCGNAFAVTDYVGLSCKRLAGAGFSRPFEIQAGVGISVSSSVTISGMGYDCCCDGRIIYSSSYDASVTGQVTLGLGVGGRVKLPIVGTVGWTIEGPKFVWDVAAHVVKECGQEDSYIDITIFEWTGQLGGGGCIGALLGVSGGYWLNYHVGAHLIIENGDVSIKVITGTDGGLDVTVDTPIVNLDWEFFGHDETGQAK